MGDSLYIKLLEEQNEHLKDRLEKAELNEEEWEEVIDSFGIVKLGSLLVSTDDDIQKYKSAVKTAGGNWRRWLKRIKHQHTVKLPEYEKHQEEWDLSIFEFYKSTISETSKIKDKNDKLKMIKQVIDLFLTDSQKSCVFCCYSPTDKKESSYPTLQVNNETIPTIIKHHHNMMKQVYSVFSANVENINFGFEETLKFFIKPMEYTYPGSGRKINFNMMTWFYYYPFIRSSNKRKSGVDGFIMDCPMKIE